VEKNNDKTFVNNSNNNLTIFYIFAFLLVIITVWNVMNILLHCCQSLVAISTVKSYGCCLRAISYYLLAYLLTYLKTKTTIPRQ